MAVLVCGGAGYIGSHFVKELLYRGYNVIVADNLSTGFKDSLDLNNRGLVSYLGGHWNLSEESVVDDIFRNNSIDSVINFASFSLVGESMNNPLKYYDNNIRIVLNLVKYMKKWNVLKLVQSSSAAVYGNHQEIYKETDKCIPINPYGKTKHIIEEILEAAGKDDFNPIKSMSLRYFNVAGAHPSGFIGEAHDPETHLIPLILKNLIAGNPIKIFGDDYQTCDGTCVRDYIHIHDLVNAHIMALEGFNNLISNSEVFNLGYGKGTSVKEIIDKAELITGLKVNRIIESRRVGDPDILIADPTKFKSRFGWGTKFPDCEINSIIASAYDWHKSHPNGYNKEDN